MPNTGFKDWIPEGEDQGAFGNGGGYQDFVGAPQAEQVVEAPEKVEVVKPTQAFKCDKCEFSTSVKVALAGHMRSHK